MKDIGSRPQPVVTTDGTNVVSPAGTALLRELADSGEAISDIGALTGQLRIAYCAQWRG